MVCGSEGEVIQHRIDPCGIFGKRLVYSHPFASVLRTKYDQWIHGKCSKLKKVTLSAAKFFVCIKCNKATNGAEVQQEVMCNKVETVKRFCYLGNRLNARGECEAAVTARTIVE